MRINISNLLNIKHLRDLRNNKYLRNLQNNKYLRNLQNNKYFCNLPKIKSLPKMAMEGLRLKKATDSHPDENEKLNTTIPAEIFLNQLERDCLKHRALRHPLLDKLSKGQPDISTMKVFAEQYYYYMKKFFQIFCICTLGLSKRTCKSSVCKDFV